MIKKQIINSLIDNDLYTLTVGQVAFHLFPRSIVTYEFFNRNKTPFPQGFADELQNQINLMANLSLTKSESDWLNTISYIRPTYIEWLSGYHFDPNEVIIKQKDGNLSIKICGPWYRTVYWEVCLLAVISELYFLMTEQEPDLNWITRINEKAKKLSDSGCHWIDFGTRRRFSGAVQDELVDTMSNYKGFLGTSNPYLAMKHGVVPHGTYSHQGPMAMSAVYGVRMANKMWMKHWSEHYEGNVGVSLTDTFTTEAFLKDFGSYEARLFDGVRHDSGDPYVWGNNMLRHYDLLGISTSNKRFVFSDALTPDTYIALDKYFRKNAQPVGGIGTNFTNDCGTVPLNMVIKMISYDGINVVKLSDNVGKNTGDSDAIRRAKESLNII